MNKGAENHKMLTMDRLNEVLFFLYDNHMKLHGSSFNSYVFTMDPLPTTTSDDKVKAEMFS
jgi:hypothetical protein